MITQQYEESNIQLAKDDNLLVYTDGITEAIDRDEAFYGEERLFNLFKNGNGNAEASVQQVVEDVDDFAKGEDQADDITIMSLIYK